MFEEHDDILSIFKDVIKKCGKSSLSLKDYSYLEFNPNYIIKYLKSYKKGVNILFYGYPGTGKTEFAKLIAQNLNKSLFEIS